MCAICNKDKSKLFTVNYKGERVTACAHCITSKHLTGWSL
jgi:hypothetical protein